ncbi:DUF6978 family protein [Methylobacterium sp. SD21]|uniref:DUF6978 family protein n=1 Tax=Methylobacterium litchii TaxID=3138810 RepID=UPI00313D2BB8
MTVALSQSEADALLVMDKRRMDNKRWCLPDLGGGISVPLTSLNGTESFQLDISRSRIKLTKGKFQHRARVTFVLARIDVGGAPHRNPDDQEIPCPHIHLYREGYGDRWAYPVPANQFSDPSDHWQTLLDFMRFCRIVEEPAFDRGLFT